MLPRRFLYLSNAPLSKSKRHPMTNFQTMDSVTYSPAFEDSRRRSSSFLLIFLIRCIENTRRTLDTLLMARFLSFDFFSWVQQSSDDVGRNIAESYDWHNNIMQGSSSRSDGLIPAARLRKLSCARFANFLQLDAHAVCAAKSTLESRTG